MQGHGFSISAREVLQVAALLEASAKRGDDSKRIKVKLGALLAKDFEHQKRLYRLFDQYLERHSWQFVPTKEKPPAKSRLSIWWERNGLALSLGIIGLTLMLFIGRWYTYNYLVELQSSANAPQINHLNGWVHLSHNSSIRQFPPLVSDSIKETRWIWGDGSEDSFGDHVIHQFSDLNQSYEVIFYQELGNGKKDTGKVNIAFKNPAEVRIMPDINNFSVGLETRYLFPENMRGAIQMNPGLKNQLDSLSDKLDLSWDLGDGSLDSGLTVSHRYRDSGNYTILVRSRLTEDIGALKQGLTFTDSISVKVPLRKNLSLIPVSKIDMKPPNINDLVKVDNSYWLFLVLSLIALGIYGLYEYLIWRRRRAVLDGSADKLPPLRQKLRIEMPELNLYGNAYFGRITTLLRKRRDSEVLDLNLAKSLKESLKQGGEYPIFAYSTRQQASQYLVLIEERNKKDHLARFYESLIKELNQRDITAEYYFFDHDPSLCWKQRSQPTTEVSLSQLLSTFAGYRLIIIGSGKGMLDPRTGELEDFVHMMDAFPEKALLSTIPNEKWGRSERELSTYFSLLPATEEGWEEMVPQWQLESLPDSTYWKAEQYEFAPPALDSENLIPELRLYLGEKRFQWLCACAVYPVLYYELTLQLGSLITEEEIGLEALGHLFRLDWFRKGNIPEEIRMELVAELRPGYAQRTRTYLMEVLNANPAPKGSLAEQDQQTTLAIYQYLNSGRRKEDLEELQESLKNLDPEDLEDLLSVKYLSDIKHDPLIIPLPKSFYRGGISIMGTQWKARLAMVLAALLAILAFIGFQDVQDLRKKTTPRYDSKDLSLFSEQDRARWHHYNAVMLEKEGDYSAASESYQNAIQYDIYSTVQRDTFIKHVWQHRFNWTWEYYQRQEFEIAQDFLSSDSLSLSTANPLLRDRKEENRPDDLLLKLMELIRTENRDTFYQPPAFVTYLIGLSRLQQNDDSEDSFLGSFYEIFALRSLNRLDRSFYQDSSRTNVFSREDSANIVLLDHLQTSNISPSEPDLVELLDKLGQPSFTYRLSIKTGNLSGANTDQDTINFRLLGSENLIEARLDSPFASQNQFEKGDKNEWKLNSAVPIGAIEKIGISLGTEESRSLDDWNIDSLILETPDGHGPYRIAVKTWIGDDKKSRYNTPQFTAKTIREPFLVLEPDYRNPISNPLTTSSLPEESVNPNIRVLDLSGRVYDPDGNLTGGIEIHEVIGNVTTQSAFNGDFSMEVKVLRANFVRLQLRSLEGQLGRKGQKFRYGDWALDTVISADLIKKGIPLNLQLKDYRETSQDIIQSQPPEFSRAKYLTPEMVYVQGGTFMMGQEDKKPGHEVAVSSFEIGKYEVTFEEFDLFCDATGRNIPSDENSGRGRKPVINVSWEDAVEYANWLSFQAGYEQVYEKVGIETNRGEAEAWRINYSANGYRLPTEAEWEFAARGGLKARNTLYSGSNDLDSVGWYSGNTKNQSKIVGQKGANELGIYDMSGNVWEWCNDWFLLGDLKTGPQNNPKGPANGTDKILRGGSFSRADNCLISKRINLLSNRSSTYFGFRLCRR